MCLVSCLSKYNPRFADFGGTVTRPVVGMSTVMFDGFCVAEMTCVGDSASISDVGV